MDSVSQIIRDLHLHEDALQKALKAHQPLLDLINSTDVSAATLALEDPYLKSLSSYQSPLLKVLEREEKILKTIQNPNNHLLHNSLEKYRLNEDVISQKLAQIDSQWLNQTSQLNSLIELQGIGRLIDTYPCFNDDVTAALRSDLGDWRNPPSIEISALLDPIARNKYYLERGLNPEFSELPAPVYRDGLVSAQLYDKPVSEDEDTDETEDRFMLTNEAHDQLMRFEYGLREFIDDLMTTKFGDDWIQHRIPPTMKEEWERKAAIDKKKQSPKARTEMPLISYADFSDYETIIIRKDNWREVFVDFFQHKPSVQESFRRLYPVRICTMHARPITLDDSLYLLVEVKRLSMSMNQSQLL